MPDGLRRLYQDPWDRTHFAEPSVASASAELDLLGARYEEGRRTLALAVASRSGRSARGTVLVAKVPRERPWTLRRQGQVVATSRAPGAIATWRDDQLALRLDVTATTRLDLSLS